MAHEERLAAFVDGADLAGQCRSQHIAIVYLGSGLGDKVPAIRSALEGGDVLTVAAVPEYVEAGIVLGFHLPKSEARGRDSPPTAHKKFSGSLLKCRKKSARVTRPIGFGMASRTLRCRRAGA